MAKQSQSNINRETAKICSIHDILNGKYIQQEGWKPSYVKISIGNISRVNVMGIVVSLDSKHQFLIDDGTGTIKVRDFVGLKNVENIRIGQSLVVIGHVRCVEDSMILVCEIVATKQVNENFKWFDFRRAQLKNIERNEIDFTAEEKTSNSNNNKVVDKKTNRIVDKEKKTTNISKIDSEDVVIKSKVEFDEKEEFNQEAFDLENNERDREVTEDDLNFLIPSVDSKSKEDTDGKVVETDLGTDIEQNIKDIDAEVVDSDMSGLDEEAISLELDAENLMHLDDIEDNEENKPKSKIMTGDDIVNFIQKNDEGSGCDVEDIISALGNESEEVINTLISMGEIYEIRAGRVKVL